jgi:hypothetical protein
MEGKPPHDAKRIATWLPNRGRPWNVELSQFAKRPQFRYNFPSPESGGNLSLFITFEGIEGCGKTTQIGLLTSFLKSLHRPFLLTREPGGTGVGEQIRQILLSSENVGIEPMAELYLYAARASLLSAIDLPMPPSPTRDTGVGWTWPGSKKFTREPWKM